MNEFKTSPAVETTYFQRKVNFDELIIPANEIGRLLGYGKDTTPEPVLHEIKAVLRQAEAIAEIQIGYFVLPSDDFLLDERQIRLGDEKLDCGKIITRYMNGSEHCAVFLCTLGRRFDDWIRDLFSAGDAMNGYIADTIGSVAVDEAACVLENEILNSSIGSGQKLTNRFSPGYCGWDVSEQRKIFALLPPGFLDVELTPSSLMIPIKSISGIIGIGRDVSQLKSTCSVCGREDCYMKNREATRQQ